MLEKSFYQIARKKIDGHLLQLFLSFKNRKVILLALFSIVIFGITSLIPVNAEPCNCVIFRFVDIQDWWLNTVRIKVMDTFIEENEKVSLSIILNSIGDDHTIVDKVVEGHRSGHFELTLHGYNHENFVTFSAQEQKNLFELSQTKMETLWGINSTSFVPPMHQYNDDTLQTMADHDVFIISAGFPGVEPPENHKFIANPPSNITDVFGVYHLPQTAEFYNHGTFPHTKIPFENIMDNVDAAISQYGYAVLNLYGTDFAQKDINGNALNLVNSTEINDLLTIFNELDSKGYTSTSFSEITKINVEPVLNSIGPKSVNVFELLSFTATATDSDLPAHTLTFSLADGTFGSVPVGASITTEGDFAWTPDESQVGQHTFDVVVTDNDSPNLSNSETITVTVNTISNNACVIPNSGDWIVNESCVISTDVTIPESMIIQNNSVVTVNEVGRLTIPSGESVIIVDGSGLKLIHGSIFNVFS